MCIICTYYLPSGATIFLPNIYMRRTESSLLSVGFAMKASLCTYLIRVVEIINVCDCVHADSAVVWCQRGRVIKSLLMDG